MSTLRTNAIQTVAGKPIVNSTGSILQVIHTEMTAAIQIGCPTPVDILGLNATITPSSNTNKVLVFVHFTGVLHCDGRIDLKVNGSTVKSNLLGSDRFVTNSVNADDAATYCASYLHSPASVSALTYQTAACCTGCTNQAYINRDVSNSSNNGRSGITLMEISA
jgi:hypothetical protein